MLLENRTHLAKHFGATQAMTSQGDGGFPSRPTHPWTQQPAGRRTEGGPPERRLASTHPGTRPTDMRRLPLLSQPSQTASVPPPISLENVVEGETPTEDVSGVSGSGGISYTKTPGDPVRGLEVLLASVSWRLA